MCGHRHHDHSTHTSHRERDRSVRASDADRDRTADVLRTHAGEGRLGPDELEERLEAAFGAKTLADLDALTTDLPAAAPQAAPSRLAWPVGVSPLLLVLCALVATSVLVGHPAGWLIFLLLFARRPFAAAHWRVR
jgi:hypothetical protein